MAEWMQKIVADLEAGIYRFDVARGTYVAGAEQPATADGSDASSTSSSNVSAAAAAAAASSGGVLPSSSASSTIGVHAFMYSALESRDFFIKDRTEELIFLPDNDFALLNTDSLGGAGSSSSSSS